MSFIGIGNSFPQARVTRNNVVRAINTPHCHEERPREKRVGGYR